VDIGQPPVFFDGKADAVNEAEGGSPERDRGECQTGWWYKLAAEFAPDNQSRLTTAISLTWYGWALTTRAIVLCFSCAFIVQLRLA